MLHRSLNQFIKNTDLFLNEISNHLNKQCIVHLTD